MDYQKSLRRMLECRVSEELQEKIAGALSREETTEEEYRDLFREIRTRRHLLKAREELDWFPSVDPQRCTGCGVCFSFCPKSVYEMEEEKVRVARPYSCVFLCEGCKGKCPQQAISFPDRQDFVGFVEYR